MWHLSFTLKLGHIQRSCDNVSFICPAHRYVYVSFLSFFLSCFPTLLLSSSSPIYVFLPSLISFPSDDLPPPPPQSPEPRYLTGDNHSKPSLSPTHNGLFCSVPRIYLLYTYLYLKVLNIFTRGTILYFVTVFRVVSTITSDKYLKH